MKEKSPRNKTLTLTPEEEKFYLDLCIKEEDFNGTELNAVVYGDSFSSMKKIPSSSVDLIIADPPYNIGKNFNGNRFSALSDEEYRIYTASWLKSCINALKEDGTIYVCCDWKSSLIIGEELKKYAVVRNRITWKREKGRGAAKNWKNCLEDIWFATKSNDYAFNLDSVKIKKKVIAPYRENGVPKDWFIEDGEKYRYTCPPNVWDDITVPYWSMKENTSHPTQKPEKLIERLILASSDEGDLVFDPFLGSGTTAVVAKRLNRNYLGIEYNGLYCAFTQKRLSGV